MPRDYAELIPFHRKCVAGFFLSGKRESDGEPLMTSFKSCALKYIYGRCTRPRVATMIIKKIRYNQSGDFPSPLSFLKRRFFKQFSFVFIDLKNISWKGKKKKQHEKERYWIRIGILNSSGWHTERYTIKKTIGSVLIQAGHPFSFKPPPLFFSSYCVCHG